jgi:hypothetical protein
MVGGRGERPGVAVPGGGCALAGQVGDEGELAG